MRTITLPYYSLSLYQVEDMPAGQFLRFQNYWEQDPGEDPNKSDASLETLAFAVCVAAISGHPVEPLPTTELPTLVALLKSYGVSPTLQHQALTTLQENSVTTLKRLFPDLLADLTLQAMTDAHMLRRFTAECQVELADLAQYTPLPASTLVPVITPIRTQQQLTEHLLDWLQPAPFGSQRWHLACEMRERVFAALCELLTRTGTPHPEELPVVDFVQVLASLRVDLS